MTFQRSSLLIRKSFLTNTLSKCNFYPCLCLFPAWKCRQTWLLPNFVPAIGFNSSQFPAYVKRQLIAWKVSVFGVFLARVFPHSRDTGYLSVFSSNAGKYGTDKLQIRTLFMQWLQSLFLLYSKLKCTKTY